MFSLKGVGKPFLEFQMVFSTDLHRISLIPLIVEYQQQPKKVGQTTEWFGDWFQGSDVCFTYEEWSGFVTSMFRRGCSCETVRIYGYFLLEVHK